MHQTSLGHGVDRAGGPAGPPAAAEPVVRYARPAEPLAELVTGYQLYAVPAGAAPRVDWVLPGAANVRLSVGAGPVEVQLGRRRAAAMPAAALIGPTTYVPCATTSGGTLVGFGLTPLGWGRLLDRSAAELCDRMVPLADAVGPALATALLDGLAAVPELDEVAAAAVLDRALAPLLGRPGLAEPEIRALAAAIGDPAVATVADVTARTGMAAPALRRVAARYFGATTKLLLRRARFLRAFLAFFRSGDEVGYPGVEEHYYDVSHLLRDADRFLGMTPRRFAALSTASLDRSLQERAAVLGGATCVLHQADPV